MTGLFQALVRLPIIARQRDLAAWAEIPQDLSPG